MRSTPVGINESCVGCPTVNLCLDIIETRDAENAGRLGEVIDIDESIRTVQTRELFEAEDNYQDSLNRSIESSSVVGQADRERLAAYTTICSGKQARLFGKAACGNDIKAQYLMLPFGSEGDTRFPEAIAIANESLRTL